MFNYEKLELKCGLEVHQQLDTGKLFSRAPSELRLDAPEFSIERKLRPVPSELGEYDKSSLDAFNRNETFIYQGHYDTISLIEIDCEPPQPMDEEALKTILEVSLLSNSHIVNKLIPMRKTVIDGSNTSAFQRTTLVSIGGELEINSESEKNKKKKIRVQTIILEEDAARPIKKENGKIYYNLDRLGIPLIELATDPDIRTPTEAIETAKKIGEIMRLTCRTKRGKGTIRQDVNVSIAEGERCEIKGCQELELIGTVVEKEIERQIDLINLKKKLIEKFDGKEKLASIIKIESIEATQIFAQTEAKFVKGKQVYGMKLSKMKGFLGEKIGAKRFGSELSNYAKATGVSGLLHRDELPNYGITINEVEEVCKKLNCTNEDNFVLIVSDNEKALKAFNAIKDRILLAFDGVVKETRGALEDGSSEYQRPLSGEARMYPETDILFREINEKYLLELKKQLPKSVAERETYYAKLELSTNHIEEMKLNNYARFFEGVVTLGANPKVAAGLLLQTLTELKRNNVATEKVKLIDIQELLLLEAKGKIQKSRLDEAITQISQGKTIKEILSTKESTKVDTNAINSKISEIVNKNIELIKAKGMGAIGPLMGDLMKESSLKGIDGKVLSEILRKEIQEKTK
ncbi:MAG: Glu-tRNA(Gln) amidotransferase subunit GatE, partial [archaeon]